MVSKRTCDLKQVVQTRLIRRYPIIHYLGRANPLVVDVLLLLLAFQLRPLGGGVVAVVVDEVVDAASWVSSTSCHSNL